MWTFRVATAEGNREFGCSFFQTGKTQGICLKILKTCFCKGIYFQHREKFDVLKIKGCTRVVLGYFHNLLTFVVNFELVNWEME